MIGWIGNWAEGIIIAVVIGTIIEMIIPEGIAKKYVKIVIGVYIMFNIITPVINKFTSKTVSFSLDDYETFYKKTNTYENIREGFEEANNTQIEEIYKQKLIEDITDKLEQKGYLLNTIKLEINTNNAEDYGKILKLNINIMEMSQREIEKSKNNKVEKVEIEKVNINNSKENTKSEGNTIQNVDELKEYLSNEYGVNINDIVINNE